MTWGEKFRKLLFDISPKRAFLELSYDPLSGYLIYRDHTKEVPMKKDLIRALVVYAEVRDRAELFDLELEVTVNQIIKFIQKAQNPIIDDHTVIGPERLPGVASARAYIGSFGMTMSFTINKPTSGLINNASQVISLYYGNSTSALTVANLRTGTDSNFLAGQFLYKSS